MEKWVIAKAEFADRQNIIALTQKIWDGEDYIPYVLDEWLTSRDPFLVAKTHDLSQIVGVDHASFFGKVAWLEGLRVDPEFQGNGIGGILYKEMMREVLQRKPFWVGALIHGENLPSVHLAEKNGFDVITSYYFLETVLENSESCVRLSGNPSKKPTILFPRDLGKMKNEFFPFLSSSSGFFSDTWVAFPEADFLQNRFLFDYPQGKIVGGIHIHGCDNFTISLFTKPGDWMKEAFEDVRAWAKTFGCKYVGLTLPSPMKEWLPVFEQYGFEMDAPDDSNSCIEYPPKNSFASQICVFKYNPSYYDLGIVQKQLQLPSTKPDNYYSTADRCGYGFPRVIECFPLQEGEPFPTTYYLTCPHLKYEISKLEETGWISQLEKTLEVSEMQRIHEVIRIKREKRLRNLAVDRWMPESFRKAFSKGVGGTKDASFIKCLHLHAATFLAGIDDPVGKAVLQQLAGNNIPEDCVMLRCSPF